ncbi:hypothetical protein GMD4S_10996 [Streptococcus sp. GMD4S]|jgi:hypothetical protein|uniref:alpha/beta fold hydrolase n=1 Tax=unclassified Streptococcus TaxID=2608887 RepID=UPI000280D947|nr:MULTISPECIES: alpha/beta hydrolase [unclassified Streptococcus]EKA02772.1 hypothetical protein GMD4S_10996 [Streptococcus sp. GMD4S]EKA06689.1 hypothetical protein GMD6S_03443 [Streptococcus sp. GMD6S]EKA10305.1 hypothetical protein GMD2S_09209 [Streptococcus sp. GMD2S]
MNALLKKKKIKIKNKIMCYSINSSWEKSKDNLLLFFIHGLSEHPLVWEKIITYLPTYRCCVLYRPGYDSSFSENESQILECVIRRLCHIQQCNNYFIVGHSLGAYITLQLNKFLPKGRVLISPFESIKLGQLTFSSYEEFEYSLEKGFKSDVTGDLKQEYFKLTREIGLSVINKDIELHSSLNSINRIIELPTLIVRPLYDQVISNRRFKKLLQKIPYATTEFIAGGHNIIYESPKLISSSIARFIEEKI